MRRRRVPRVVNQFASIRTGESATKAIDSGDCVIENKTAPMMSGAIMMSKLFKQPSLRHNNHVARSEDS